MICSQDRKQYYKCVFIFCIEIYKIFIGTFLTLTVPKYCKQNSCTILENIYDNNVFHRCALGINIINFCLLLLMYYYEIIRENWCIKYLDVDLEKSMSNLDIEIETYPDLKKYMRQINLKYNLICKICIFNQVINICISLVDIIIKYYGFRSLIPFLTYIMVIIHKLYNSYNVSSESLKHERAYSAFLTELTIYNTIDEDYKND